MSEIKIHLRAFAQVRQIVGHGDLQLALPAGSTAGDLLKRLETDHPAIAPYLGRMVVTVNRQYVGREHTLSDGDEVAIFLPVSGGSSETIIAISGEPIDVGACIARVTEPGAGAVVTFAGVVRDSNLGRPVDYLEYEAYAEMAEARMQQVVAEARERWPKIRRVALVHRVGHLALGETAALVVVGAPHRDDGAFEAARYSIDRLKEIVPIWKKEGWADGAAWLEGDYHPRPGE